MFAQELVTEFDETSFEEIVRSNSLQSLEKFKKEIRESISQVVRKYLFEKVRGWSPSEEAIKQFPFFRNLENFVSRYSKCVDVDFSQGQMNVGFSEELLQLGGFPRTISVDLETGTEKIPSFPHLMQSLEIWEREEAPKLFEELVLSDAFV